MLRDSAECWRGRRLASILIHCRRECKMVQGLWRTVWQFLIELNMHLHDSQQQYTYVFTPKK